MQRTIPVTASGVTKQVAMYDKPAPAWEPPTPTETVKLSHHIEPPDYVDARGWAGAFGFGGAIIAVPLGVMWLYDSAVVGDWVGGGRGLIRAGLIVGVAYMLPLTVHFILRCLFDNRTRNALPPPRLQTKIAGKAAGVIEARKVELDYDPAKLLHHKKLLALVLWATSTEYDTDGHVIKKYGLAPTFQRKRGYKGRRELPVEGTAHIIQQEEQNRLYDELSAIGIFEKHPHPVGWGLTDLTWKRPYVLELMKAAYPP